MEKHIKEIFEKVSSRIDRNHEWIATAIQLNGKPDLLRKENADLYRILEILHEIDARLKRTQRTTPPKPQKNRFIAQMVKDYGHGGI